MGEEHKKEEKQEEAKEDKKEEDAPEIVLKVDMHCEACAREVARALKGFKGVEEVRADSKASKVVVKGKEADPKKVCERLQKKSGRKVELLSPLPIPQEQHKEEKKEPHPEEKKQEPPPVATVVLKVRMHCEACAEVIRKRIRKIQGVESVETDLGSAKVIVKGVIEAAKLADYVYKRTGKQASIVKDDEEEKKEEKEEAGEDKGEEKEEAGEDKGEEKEDKDEDDNKADTKRFEYWPPPPKDYVDYACIAPHFFSDENPNACSLM